MAYLSYGEYPAYYEFDSDPWFNSSINLDPALTLSNGTFYDDILPGAEDNLKMSTFSITSVVVSSAGILVNLFFLALIVADFTVKRRRRKHLRSRHWLLLNLCVAHLVYLITEVVFFTTTMDYAFINDTIDCASIMHFLHAGPFTVRLGLCLVALHTCMYVMRPSSNNGNVSVLIWLSAVFLNWLVSHIATHFLIRDSILEERLLVDGALLRICFVQKTTVQKRVMFYEG